MIGANVSVRMARCTLELLVKNNLKRVGKEMNQLITSIKVTVRLFNQPKKMGEVIEVQDQLYVIIGIEQFKIYGQQLSIWYTVQNLEAYDFISKQIGYPEKGLIKLNVQYKYNDKRFEHLQIGRTVPYQEEQFKIVEYTDIILLGTDIKVSFLVKKVLPLNRKEAKMRYFMEKQKKLNIDLL